MNWNGAADIEACLQSLVAQTTPPAEIVVVDNGSTDDSVRRIRNGFPNVTLIEAAKDFDEMEITAAKAMTAAEGSGLARIREAHLGADASLEPEAKARFLSATTHTERLRELFGSIAANYERLAVAKR